MHLPTIPDEIYIKIVSLLDRYDDVFTAASILGTKLTFPVLFSNILIEKKDPVILDALELFKVETKECQLCITTGEPSYITVLVDGFGKDELKLLRILKPYITHIWWNIDEPIGSAVTEFIKDLPNLKYADTNFEVKNINVTMLVLDQFKPEWLQTTTNLQKLTLTGIFDVDRAPDFIVSSKKFPQLSYLKAAWFPVKFVDIMLQLRELKIDTVCKGIENLPNLKTFDMSASQPDTRLSLDFLDAITNKLETLILHYVEVPVFSLDRFPLLEELVIILCSFREICIVSDTLKSVQCRLGGFEKLLISCPTLETLSLTVSEQLETLGPQLENCKHLRTLYLSCVTEVLQLPELESLEELRIQGGKIELLKTLCLPKLEIIDTFDSEIKFIEEFNCPLLKGFTFVHGGLRELQFSKNCKNIETMKLSRNKICDLSGMWFPDSLKRLDLSSNSIIKLQGLGNLSNLERLYIHKNPELAEIEKFAENIPLKVLDISFTKVNSLKPFVVLSKLEDLKAKRCSVRQIERLNGMSELRTLRLESNEITKIENLEPLCSLRTLNLCRNPITRFESLKSLKFLESLLLDNTEIAILDGDEIRGLNNLKVLSVRSSQVEMVVNFHNLPLVTLNLENNRITQVGGIRDMPNMCELLLGQNPISVIDKKFQNFPKLKALTLYDRPLGSDFKLDTDARGINKHVHVDLQGEGPN